MRAFEVIFADQQKKQWYKNTEYREDHRHLRTLHRHLGDDGNLLYQAPAARVHGRLGSTRNQSRIVLPKGRTAPGRRGDKRTPCCNERKPGVVIEKS
jgi:hypothetical protein